MYYALFRSFYVRFSSGIVDKKRVYFKNWKWWKYGIFNKIILKSCINETIFKKKVKEIRVLKDRKLIFFFKNGDEIETQWEYPSRSEGWTEEMREKARLKSLAYNGGVING